MLIKKILLFVKFYLGDFDKSHARAQVESLGRLVAGLHLLDTKVSHNCLHWCILMIIKTVVTVIISIIVTPLLIVIFNQMNINEPPGCFGVSA